MRQLTFALGRVLVTIGWLGSRGSTAFAHTWTPPAAAVRYTFEVGRGG